MTLVRSPRILAVSVKNPATAIEDANDRVGKNDKCSTEIART